MPFNLGYALENQTLALHGPTASVPASSPTRAAHQWLGNSVTLEDWSDIWMNEGFAPTCISCMRPSTSKLTSTTRCR